MVQQRNYHTMNLRVRALMVSAGALKDRFEKGNTLPNGLSAAYISDIQSFSSQLHQDFLDLKTDYDAGKIGLEFYVKQMNILFALVNSNVTTDEDRLGVDEIRAEHNRLDKMINPPTPEMQQPVKKGTVTKPIIDPFEALKKSQAGLDKALSDLDKFAKSLPQKKRVS